MLLEHLGERPTVHEGAFIAPTAVVCGDVEVGAGAQILFGAVITAESGPVRIGERNVIMEHAVIRGVSRHPLTTGDHVMVGPGAHLSGCTIGDDVFIATGATVFNGAAIEGPSEVRVNGVVHVASTLPPGTTVPIGWVAVGDPAQVLPPDRHDDIWTVQRKMDFPGRVFGVERARPGETRMPQITRRYSDALGRYAAATTIDG